jgi:hypothetical protein
MFSTSVGLLLKGLEYYCEKKEEMVLADTGPDQENEAVLETAEGRRPRKGTRKGKIFESLKNTLSDIFDETDVKM